MRFRVSLKNSPPTCGIRQYTIRLGKSQAQFTKKPETVQVFLEHGIRNPCPPMYSWNTLRHCAALLHGKVQCDSLWGAAWANSTVILSMRRIFFATTQKTHHHLLKALRSFKDSSQAQNDRLRKTRMRFQITAKAVVSGPQHLSYNREMPMCPHFAGSE